MHVHFGCHKLLAQFFAHVFHGEGAVTVISGPQCFIQCLMESEYEYSVVIVQMGFE